jgi:hypothetical protein
VSRVDGVELSTLHCSCVLRASQYAADIVVCCRHRVPLLLQPNSWVGEGWWCEVARALLGLRSTLPTSCPIAPSARQPLARVSGVGLSTHHCSCLHRASFSGLYSTLQTSCPIAVDVIHKDDDHNITYISALVYHSSSKCSRTSNMYRVAWL